MSQLRRFILFFTGEDDWGDNPDLRSDRVDFGRVDYMILRS